MTAYTAADIEARKLWTTIYIQLPDHRLPLRFTRTTEQHWKRVDGLADGRQWVTHEQLADLANVGVVTNPFTGAHK